MPTDDHPFYAASSGLTPAAKFSVSDHKWAYILQQAAALRATLTVANLNKKLGR